MRKIFILICFIFLSICICLSSNDGKYNGIDISHYNSVNWSDIANDSNIKFCYIKASEGAKIKDSKCKKHVNSANKLGLNVGLYHYFRTETSAEKQFLNFKEVYDANKTNLIPVIDVEDEGNVFDENANKILEKLILLFKKEYKVYPIIYYGSLGAIKTIPVTYKCKKWISIKNFNYIPSNIISIKQISIGNIGDNYVDLNYANNIDKLILK